MPAVAPRCAHAIVIALSIAASAAAQSPPPAESLSPAQQRIAVAEKALAASKTADGYNSLALALARRARETADPVYYDRANDAINQSLQLDPNNLEAQKMRVWVLLGRHEFADARELARTLNKQNADDLLIYGFLTDANAELGRYDEAEQACQWMLDLRPGNIPALTRAAYLRELFGDIEGAVELMNAAYERTLSTEVEDRAWILTQIGHLALIAGRVDDADHVLNAALMLFPEYHYALANLAKVRTAQKRYEDAVTLLRKRYDAAPHPENLFDLAEALARAGRASEAQTAFNDFETRAKAEMTRLDNSNKELIFYYADHAQKPAEALKIGELEIARRQDVYTLAAYAWALHVNARSDEARPYIQRALAVGVRDPELLARADAISGHR
jgi:tetratricopeptide (TPR) repeat protein